MSGFGKAGPGGRGGRGNRARGRTPIGELPDYLDEAEEARIREARWRWLAEMYGEEPPATADETLVLSQTENLADATQDLQLSSDSATVTGSSFGSPTAKAAPLEEDAPLKGDWAD